MTSLLNDYVTTILTFRQFTIESVLDTLGILEGTIKIEEIIQRDLFMSMNVYYSLHTVKPIFLSKPQYKFKQKKKVKGKTN